jgi:CDP-diacylglycerol--serine O-phosphatidyltransferase
MKQIPNIFTLLNLIFGCFAIVYILQNGIVLQYNAEGSQIIEIPEKIVWASVFIGLAAVVDFLDGFVARLFKATSEMGKQLDSLADVVSFGVAPSMILFQLLRLSFASNEDGMNTSVILLAPAFIVAACAAYRLAKFNIDQTQQTTFKGMPTPAVGIVVASLPLIYWYTEYTFVYQLILNKWVIYGLILFLGFMMVSNLPMMSFKLKSKKINQNLPQILLVVAGLLMALFFHWLAIPFIFIIYIILSQVFKNQLK